MQKGSYRFSFTLIEMLVVVVIIGILAGVLIPRLIGAKDRANDSARLVKVGQITTAVDMYAQDNGGVYPIAPLSTGGYSTVEMIANKISPFLSTIPTDPGKGIAAIVNLDKSCILTGNSFGYTTDPGGTMFAVTALMESKKGNTSNCLGIVNSNKGGSYEVAGKGLTYNVETAGGSAGGSGLYLPEWAWTPASCLGFSAGTITSYTENGTTCKKVVVIPEKINGIPVTTIGSSAFTYKGLTSISMPPSITTIKSLAFYVNSLTSVIIPSSVVSIESTAFATNQITSINIPSSVTVIGGNAFIGNNLTSVNIPSSVTVIGGGAFNTNQLADNLAFFYARNPDGSEDKTKLISYGGSNKQPIIPSSVTRIELGAFYFCHLTSVTIPNSVTYIGQQAFDANQFTSVTIPDSVVSISNRAFWRNRLTSITIPSSVTSLGTDAFLNNGPSGNSANITDFVPNTLQTRNLSGTTWVKQP